MVGPNGSGKSNVIDAMLFVFGKRAKQLRLNKVSELIHNSTHHQNLEQAKVSVHFQEIVDLVSDPPLWLPPSAVVVSACLSSGAVVRCHLLILASPLACPALQDDEQYAVIPDSGFVVSRTAHRSNKSDYYINERKSNFTEVTELLKGKGIDLDNNRFLILQGEVEQISMMKPKAQTEHDTGLLEYLEDIIGTDRYVPAIDAGAKQLEELNDKRQGMVQRVKIAERERDALEGEKAAAEAYLAKERECLGTQSVLAQVFVKDSKVSLTSNCTVVLLHAGTVTRRPQSWMPYVLCVRFAGQR